MRPFRFASVLSMPALLSLSLIAVWACVCGLQASAQTKPASTARVSQDFDAGWKYTLGPNLQAEQPEFDDSSWKAISLPHDASIAGPIDRANPSGPAGGFFPAGVVCYRKSFTLPQPMQHHRAYLVFEGVMANSEVWINGVKLGERPNGYVSFNYDLTDNLRSGSNEVAVRCDTSKQPASRWYEGLGIYRPVHLVVTDEVHIAPWSTFVTTPAVSADAATVQVQTEIQNDSAEDRKVALQVTLLGPDGKRVAQA